MKDASTVLEPSGLYYPNRFARYMLAAMADVMGTYGLKTVLNMAGLDDYADSPPPDDMARQFDFAYIAAINRALEEVYGPRGGHSIAMRVGQAMFTGGLKRFGGLAGMITAEFQALPDQQRAKLGLQALARVFSGFTDQETTVESAADHYRFVVTPSPMTWGRHTDQPVSHMFVGILQETLRYATQGFLYHVWELPPEGDFEDSTVFRINKEPIGGVRFG